MISLRSSVISLFPSLSASLLYLLSPAVLVDYHNTVITTLSAVQCLLFFTASSEAILTSCRIISLATIASVGLSILFGAHPLRFWDNLSWGFLMGSLLIVPAISLLGSKFQTWETVFLQHRFNHKREQFAFMCFFGTLVGAWVGAFPLLLDWNKPWQVWPIPCSLGALIGNLAGYCSAGVWVWVGSGDVKTF